MVGRSVGVGGQPLIEGNGEVEEFLFAVQRVDLLDVEQGVDEGGLVEAPDVVEEIAR